MLWFLDICCILLLLQGYGLGGSVQATVSAVDFDAAFYSKRANVTALIPFNLACVLVDTFHSTIFLSLRITVVIIM